jgi:hypothetical protein
MDEDQQLDLAGVEQHAALDAIGAEAALGEQEQEQKLQQATEPPNPMAGAAGWAMIAQGLGGMFAIALPEVAGAYTPDACMNWGVAMDALSQKYGWEGGVSRFGPEIAVVMASAPLVVPVVVAVKARKAAEARKVEAIQPVGAEPMRDGAPVEVLS